MSLLQMTLLPCYYKSRRGVAGGRRDRRTEAAGGRMDGLGGVAGGWTRWLGRSARGRMDGQEVVAGGRMNKRWGAAFHRLRNKLLGVCI